MGTRSEIRHYKEGKIVGCTYHHYDGYPGHVVQDISQSEGLNPTKSMKALSKKHGTLNPKCAFGEKSEKNQGDIEYSYKVNISSKNKVSNIRVNECEWKGNGVKCDKKIFSGSLNEAKRKYLRGN